MASDDGQTRHDPTDDEPQPKPDFSGIAGLSMSQSLFHLPGHENILARVLSLFADHYRPGLPALDGLLLAGRWHDARQQLHALRGSSSAAGAVELTAQAQRLESRLQDAAGFDAGGVATLRHEASALNQVLITLAAAIDQRLAAAAQPPGG